MAMNRRVFLAGAGGTALAGFAAAAGTSAGAMEMEGTFPGGTLDLHTVPKFVTPLVVPPAMPTSGRNSYSIAVREFMQQMLPAGYPPTKVWGYGSTTDAATFHSPTYTIEAERGVSIEVTWINELQNATGNYLPHLLPVDPTLHWANPAGPRDMRPRFEATPGPYTGPVPIVAHVHGMANVEDWSDGYAEAWYLPAAANIPPGFFTTGTWYDFFKAKSGGAGWGPGRATYRYPNTQRPAMLWFHDHALGLTRLNVYAGLAGLYVIRSTNPADHPTVAGSNAAATLPNGIYEIPLAIQDRSFNADGSLFYPASRTAFDRYAGPYIPATAVPPIWVPEFFGHCMVVNGRTWPYREVEPRRYLLRILNGCNSRFLILTFSDQKARMWQIGTDGGYLRAPVRLTQLVLAPSERADVIVDFADFAPGDAVILQNIGPDAPYRGGDDGEAADPRTTGQIMQFRIGARPPGQDPTTLPDQLVMPAIPTLEGGRERPLALIESMATTPSGEEFPAEVVLGTIDPALPLPAGITALKWHDDITENPASGDIETWALYNYTADAHPMHVHEVLFQVISHQAFDRHSGKLVGQPRKPRPEENGWKDTVTALPGEVTRVRMRFVKEGQYVWHCHIVEHEDNEMMRPFRIGPMQPGQPGKPM